MQSQKKVISNNNNSLFYYFESSFKTDILAASGLLVLLVVFRCHIFENIKNYYIGTVQGDGGLYLWLLKSNFTDLFSLTWFNKLTFYPYSDVLAWSDNFILPSIFARLLFTAGFSDQLTYNIILLSAGFLNGYLTYILSMRISGEAFASFFAGSSFMTLAYFSHQLGHPQIQFFFFIPLGIIFLIQFINKQCLSHSMPLAINIIAAFLTTVAYSIFLVLIYAVILLAVKILRPSAVTLKTFKPLIISAIFTFIFLAPFILPYLRVQETFGERHIYEAYYFAADIFSYASSAPQNLLYSASGVLSHSEAHLFPGLTLLLLSLFAVSRIGEAKKLKFSLILFSLTLTVCIALTLLPSNLHLRPVSSILLWIGIFHGLFITYQLGMLEKRLGVSAVTLRDLIAIFSVLGFLFFSISFGPLGNPEKNQLAIAPFSFFYTILPGFSSIRAISRAGSVVLFCLCIVSSLYLSILFKKRAMRGMAILALFAVLSENYNFEYPISSLPQTPQNFKTLRDTLPESVVAILPIAGQLDRNNEVASWSEYAKFNMSYMLWGSEIPMLNGYSGQKTNIMRTYPRELKDFPSQRALNAIGRIAGIQYLIYVPQFNQNFDKSIFEKELAGFRSQIKLLSTDSDGTYLFEIHPELLNSQIKTILVPSKSKEVSLEIRTLFKHAKDQITLNVFIDENNSVPVSTFKTNSDGSWNYHKISIPDTGIKVRPVTLSLSAQDESGLVLRNINSK